MGGSGVVRVFHIQSAVVVLPPQYIDLMCQKAQSVRGGLDLAGMEDSLSEVTVKI